MKKNSILYGLIFIFSYPLCVKAQSYTLNSGKEFTINIGFNGIEYNGLEFTNISSQTLALRWKKIDIDTVAGSNFDMCASGECYLGIPDSGVFYSFPTLPGEIGFLKMHFWSGTTEGISKARVYIYDTLAPNNGDTLVFIMNIIQATTIAENIEFESFKMYPNPTNQYVFIEANSELSKENYSIILLNSLGKLVYRSNLLSIEMNTIDVGNLANGIYFAQILSDNKGIIQTKKVIVKK